MLGFNADRSAQISRRATPCDWPQYVKFREESFGGVLFETRSEKVFTLNPTAAAVIREIQSGASEAEIAQRLQARYDDSAGATGSPRPHRRLAVERPRGGLGLTGAAADTAATPAIAPASSAGARRSGDLGAPLYVAWQITNECNLACLHCIEESGPGKAFPDELDGAVFAIIDQMIALEIPYVSFSGGEPMVHPHFFAMVEHFCAAAASSRSRPTDTTSPPKLRALAALGVKAVQVSLDGASRETFNRMRVRGEFDTAVDGLRNLRAAGVPIEVNFSPTCFNRTRSARPSTSPTTSARTVSTRAARCTPATPSRRGDIWRRRRSDTRSSSTSSARRPTSIAAACGSTSTRRACSRNCATGCSNRRRF